MPWNGAGQFLRSITSWVVDKATYPQILASRVDIEFDNVATGLTNCLTRDGQTFPLTDIGWNGKNLSNVNVLSAKQILANPSGNGTGVEIRIGNDAHLGDVDVPNSIALKGVQDPTKGYLFFGNGPSIGWDGASFLLNGSPIYTAANLSNVARTNVVNTFSVSQKINIVEPGIVYSNPGIWAVKSGLFGSNWSVWHVDNTDTPDSEIFRLQADGNIVTPFFGPLNSYISGIAVAAAGSAQTNAAAYANATFVSGLRYVSGGTDSYDSLGNNATPGYSGSTVTNFSIANVGGTIQGNVNFLTLQAFIPNVGWFNV